MTAAASSPHPSIVLTTAQDPRELEILRGLFLEYAQSLNIDLAFQNFEEELRNLPGDYAAPRGALLLAWVDGQAAGCCALRPLDTVDYANACEMKRLYVRPAFRKLGLGRRLSEAALDAARVQAYDHVLLDTLDDMEAARALYEDLGFVDIPPYYHNPIAGAHYLLATLSGPRK
jgi:putative acetyltransferase